MKNNRFAKGSGCYTCRLCKLATRETGGSESFIELCHLCYELAGIENEIEDCGSTPKLEAEIVALKCEILARGGEIRV